MQDANAGYLLNRNRLPAGETTDSANTTARRPGQSEVASAIDDAKQFLPSQGPLSVFVHHNPLHMFESMPFEQAVLEGGKRFGCEPYLPEDRYRDELRKGRISVDHLRQILIDDLDESADTLVANFGTRYSLRLAMLQMNLHRAPEAELRWLLAESKLLRRFQDEVSGRRRDQMIAATRHWVMRCRDDSSESPSLPTAVEDVLQLNRGNRLGSWSDSDWESFTLKLIWRACRDGVQHVAVPTQSKSSQRTMLELLGPFGGTAINEQVNEVLIRFCGGYLDQGFADWALPDRELGFAKSFATLFLSRWTVGPAWMRHVRSDLQAIIDAPFDPLESIADSLSKRNEVDIKSSLHHSLLALRGWAGMILEMETHSEHLSYPVSSGSLNEYLAIRLILENRAIAEIGQREFRTRDLHKVRQHAEAHLQRRGVSATQTVGPTINERTYTVFQLAQAGGWTPEQLLSMSIEQWSCLVQEIESFDSVERRRLFHLAYECQYQTTALDALATHCSRRSKIRRQEKHPAYLAICCIDDREESFRRHLEEVDADCETASAAGFFAVAMYYQGADHAQYRPLCPAIVTPKHFVREEPTFSSVTVNEKRATRRRRIGWMTHQVHSHSRTLIGGWFTGVFGAFATFPMVARILAPRLTSRIRESFGTWVKPPATELHIERESPEPGQSPEALGYSIEEMADIVVRILHDIGRVSDLPPIIVFFGHGSGSLNNPHESAYHCGACSGGRGGPNARAFANMANDPRVRRLTAERGIEIPVDIRFVGAFHNTCDDDVEYYDLDLLPRTHRELFRRIESSVDEARKRNAHERSRRFESARLDMTPSEALGHVEQRGEDLSQARPEYNHATNALVTVGRRDWTRGLFMDRRVFLTEYDPAVDDENASVLTRILQAAVPVCAGINLEYYFSTVDVEGYGCGSKLPHNVASMIGVMTGAASDLRPGLSQQMIEIHEPMRILFVIETSPENLNRIIDENLGIARLVKGNWVQVALIDPGTSEILRYVDGKYVPHLVETTHLPAVESSVDWYRGNREHLGFASIVQSESISTQLAEINR